MQIIAFRLLHWTHRSTVRLRLHLQNTIEALVAELFCSKLPVFVRNQQPSRLLKLLSLDTLYLISLSPSLPIFSPLHRLFFLSIYLLQDTGRWYQSCDLLTQCSCTKSYIAHCTRRNVSTPLPHSCSRVGIQSTTRSPLRWSYSTKPWMPPLRSSTCIFEGNGSFKRKQYFNR